LISSAKIANLVDAFFQDVFHTAEPVPHTARPLAIRQKITEYAKFLEGNGANPEQVFSALQQMRDRAFREIIRHSPNRVATPSAEFFQEVFDLLSRRMPTSIDHGKGGFRVIVSIPDALPHIAKAEFETGRGSDAEPSSHVDPSSCAWVPSGRARPACVPPVQHACPALPYTRRAGWPAGRGPPAAWVVDCGGAR
jgi:hypothetical protein